MQDIRLFGVIRQDGPEQRAFYRKRQDIKRVFMSMKQSRRLDRQLGPGLRQVRLHGLRSALSFQATVLVRLQASQQDRMR